MRSRWVDSERGSVTAELAVTLPAVALVLAACLTGVRLVGDNVRLVDAAADAAPPPPRGGARGNHHPRRSPGGGGWGWLGTTWDWWMRQLMRLARSGGANPRKPPARS